MPLASSQEARNVQAAAVLWCAVSQEAWPLCSLGIAGSGEIWRPLLPFSVHLTGFCHVNNGENNLGAFSGPIASP